MWKREDLIKATQKRRDEQKNLHPKIQRAALAYARYMNLTEERGIDPEEAKAELDVLIDEITILDLWEDHEKLTVQIHRDLAAYKEQREIHMLGQSRTLDELKSQADLSKSVAAPGIDRVDPGCRDRVARRSKGELVHDHAAERLAGHVHPLPEARGRQEHRVRGGPEHLQQCRPRRLTLHQNGIRQRHFELALD